MALTLNDYFMGRREKYPNEFNPDFGLNAEDLLQKVNKLLELFGEERSVISGWRPPSLNSKVKDAAKKSNHMTGNAIDLADDIGTLDKWCNNNQDILEDCGLYLEHPNYTPRWCHLQRVQPYSEKRVFIP